MTRPLRLLIVVCLGGGIAVIPADALACPVCFGMEEGPAASGVRAAVLVLMGATMTVLAGAAVFVGRFVRRAAKQPGEPPAS